MTGRCVVVLNDLDDRAQGDASLGLAGSARDLGVETWVVDVRGLTVWPDDTVRARGVRLAPAGEVADLIRGDRDAVTLQRGDVMWVRTNPARDPSAVALHRHLPLVAELAERQGVRVENAARTLAIGWTKLMLAWLPHDIRPHTLVTADLQTLVDWLRHRDAPSVVKPATGTHGRGVFLVRPDDGANLVQMCEAVLASGPAIAQAFVDWEGSGDIRVLLLDGEPIRISGRDAAVHRIPPTAGFRSNVHAGGAAHPVTLTPRQRDVAFAAGATLLPHGVRVAGLDLIGDKVIEVNVHAPGGLGDMSLFTGENIVQLVAERLLQPLPLGAAQMLGEAVTP